jgi:non-lysosomal glucosylceramidase
MIMLKPACYSLLLLLAATLHAQDLPVIRHFDGDHLKNVALPLGGIGTGTVSLGGRGELRDWSIMNKPGIGFSTITDGNEAPFFAIHLQRPDGSGGVTRALLGPIQTSEYQHYEGRPVNHHGLPRFSHASFDAAYPFGRVYLSDEQLPVKVELTGFNPFIPGRVKESSIPIAILRYAITNTSNQDLAVSVCGTLRNFVGIDGRRQSRDWKGDKIYSGAKNNINEFRSGGPFAGLYMYSKGVDSTDPAWGTIALTTRNVEQISYRRSSVPDDWQNAMLDFWDDFSADGMLTDKDRLVDDNPMASLASRQLIPAGATRVFEFYFTWHFPNRLDWNDSFNPNPATSRKRVGNYYTTVYRDAWDVLQQEFSRLPELEAGSLSFLRAFAGSDLPSAVKEAALFNLSTLRSQTVFRLPSGHLMGWEGVMNEFGSCYGNCTHVWNYETATAFLFGDLARSMREVELDYGSKPNGKMINRVTLPLEDNVSEEEVAAADGQMGSVMRFYREWLLSGDMNWLRKYWPRVKRAIAYAWIPGGWDGNRDGVEEGRQHNTMDVEYYGPNPQMQFWYFGALRAGMELARVMGDKPFGDSCQKIWQSGRQWVDANLFNGEYYEHHITDPADFSRFLNMDDPSVALPPFQLGRGCLVDQLAGQYMAHVCGLGYLADSGHIRTTLKNIMRYNYVQRFDTVFNNMRSFVMDREPGLIMASWPKGRLKVPFPYFAESMSGFEYTAAIGMIYEGDLQNGLTCVESIRNRFDGAKRNPFDEPECGHHYARAMASWSLIPALTGFHFDGYRHRLTVGDKRGQFFWSNGYAWGTYRWDGKQLEISVLEGDLLLQEVTVTDVKIKKLKSRLLHAGESLTVF